MGKYVHTGVVRDGKIHWHNYGVFSFYNATALALNVKASLEHLGYTVINLVGAPRPPAPFPIHDCYVATHTETQGVGYIAVSDERGMTEAEKQYVKEELENQ